LTACDTASDVGIDMTGLPAGLLEGLRLRAGDLGRAVDIDRPFVVHRIGDGCAIQLPPDRPRQPPPAPASPAQLAASEELLGFRLPVAVRQLYGEVANGGFGPSYGLLGLVGGATSTGGQTAVDCYRVLRLPDGADPSRVWPRGRLPVCDWDDGLSCLDCLDEAVPVIRYDHERVADGVGRPATFTPEARTLEAWLRAWVDGEDLFATGHAPNPLP
jgi:hypothetical protein